MRRGMLCAVIAGTISVGEGDQKKRTQNINLGFIYLYTAIHPLLLTMLAAKLNFNSNVFVAARRERETVHNSSQFEKKKLNAALCGHSL